VNLIKHSLMAALDLQREDLTLLGELGWSFTVSSKQGLVKEKPPRARRQSRDVKQELIDEALKILAYEDLGEFTLRKVAARVGVSHAAPAHHFNGLPDLLGCVCRVGFQQLDRTIREHRSRAENEPYARLISVCRGYVAFARENPGLMTLMFNTSRDKVNKSAMGNAGQEAYALLKKACDPFEPIGTAPDATETHIWCLVHGMALLHLGGRFGNPGRVTADPDIADVLPKLTLRPPS